MSESTERGALLALRDAARELLRLEADPARPDEAVQPARRRAASRYADYVARYGPLNRGELQEAGRDPDTDLPVLRWRRPELDGFRADPDYLTVMALERYDAETGRAEPAPILRHRVHGRSAPAAVAGSPFEALAICLGEGGLRLDRIAQLLELPDAAAAVDALGELVYRDPARGGQWVTARDYLSGDLRERLAVATAAARDDPGYTRNVTALQAAVPPDLEPADIGVSLGAPWICAGDIEEFVYDVFGTRVTVWHLPSAAHWRVVAAGKAPRDGFGLYSTPGMNGYRLLEAGLNGRAPIVYDVVYRTGHRVRVRNLEQSLAAQERLTALQERFRSWVWEDAARCRRLCAEYNRRFNDHAPVRADGAALTFPGLAVGTALWPWQRDVVAQIVSSPTTLCAHPVGAGKTRSMVCAALTARRLGLAGKPLIAVPAHLVEQTAREARQAYPAGRFLVAGEELAGSRQQLITHCATGDWDAVIVSHGLFSGIPVAPETEIGELERQLEQLNRELEAGRGGRYGRTVLRRRMHALQDRIELVRDRPRPSLCFEELGVDLLLIDEAHYFKRLPVVSRLSGVSLGASQRAADLLLKARVLRARRGDRPTLALFTGTPWSNSLAETFVWQTYLQPEALAAAGVANFDAWAAVFLEYEALVEVRPDASGIRLTHRLTKLRNLPELHRMLAHSAALLDAEVLTADRPQRREHTVVCLPGTEQECYVHGLTLRVDKLRRERTRGVPGGDNMLTICTDGRRAALDPLLVGIAEPASKIAALADEVVRLRDEHRDVRLPGSAATGVLQVVFCDQGTPGPDGLQTYGRIRIALAERGIAPERVRWVHEAGTGAARTALFAACRAGRVDVLIGSTDKLGVGTNVQARLRAVHHLDAPWRPSDIEQREGRALRPGNGNPVVDVYRYVTKGSFDAYMWQTLQRKAVFIERMRRGRDPARTADDIGEAALSFAEVKALATGNVLLLEHAQAAGDVARLRIVQALDQQAVTAARRALASAQADRFRHREQEKMLRAAVARLTAGGPPADDPEAIATELAARLRDRLRERPADPALADRPGAPPDPAPIRAPWRGLGVELIPAGGWRAPRGDAVLLRITLAHRRVDEVSIPGRRLRQAPAPAAEAIRGALRGWLTGLDDRLAEVVRLAGDAADDAARAGRAIEEHAFARRDELAAAEARLAEISTALEASVPPPTPLLDPLGPRGVVADPAGPSR